MKVSLVLVLLCMTLISAKVYQKDEKRKAMHKEMREYAEENIIPVLKKQRLKLDKKLSAQDKEIIETMRASLHEAHKAHKAEMKKYHEQLKSGEIDKEAMHKHFKAVHEEKKEQLAPVQVIADRYESEIEKLLAVAKANKETWKEGMETIRIKYISDEELAKKKAEHQAKRKYHGPHQAGEHGQRHGGHRGGKRMHRGGHHLKMLHHAFSPVGFLLWDANAPLPSFDEEESEETLGVYPNPSRATNTIAFDVAKRGNVTVELLDKQGNVLKTLLNETKGKGKHSLAVDLAGLANEVYYYRVVTASGSQTSRFVISK